VKKSIRVLEMNLKYTQWDVFRARTLAEEKIGRSSCQVGPIHTAQIAFTAALRKQITDLTN
jgi:hypothetical protein